MSEYLDASALLYYIGLSARIDNHQDSDILVPGYEKEKDYRKHEQKSL